MKSIFLLQLGSYTLKDLNLLKILETLEDIKAISKSIFSKILRDRITEFTVSYLRETKKQGNIQLKKQITKEWVSLSE